MTGKAELRRHLRSVRRGVSPENHRRWSAALVRQLECETAHHMAIAGFVPMSEEPDVSSWLQNTVDRGVMLILPRIVGWDPPRLTWHRVASLDALVPNRWGIGEPRSDDPYVSLDDVTVMVIPGVAFGLDGARLGMGAGFYDRALHPLPRGRRIGVCFELSVLPTNAIPTDQFDIGMQRLITEAQVITVD